MIPAACPPTGIQLLELCPSPMELERDDIGYSWCCPRCGVEFVSAKARDEVVADLKKQVNEKQSQLAKLQVEISKTKQSLHDVVESRRALAELWNHVLRARSKLELSRRACDWNENVNMREMEELLLLEKSNTQRSERLKRVQGKDFSSKERRINAGIMEDRKKADSLSAELTTVRRGFITDLYRRVFPIEVLPLSASDAGAEDYQDHTRIDCNQVLDVDEGWVLGGIHCHPTPHISIVTPSLPANGDYTPYLLALRKRSRNKGVPQEPVLHPFNDPYLSTPAALVYIAQFVELIAWVLDQPLPFPLHRTVAISEYGYSPKRRNVFLHSMARLDDNIMHLCFSQHVPQSALAAGHTLQNLLALVTHTQLGRSGAFESHPNLIVYGGLRKRTDPVRESSLSQDLDEPPNVSYIAEMSCDSSASDNEEEEEEEEEEENKRDETDDHRIGTDGPIEWEHLEPSVAETRLFEEEQMKLALHAKATDGQRQYQVHRLVEEQDIQRQRLRRLDYDSTYKDYVTLQATAAASPAAPEGIQVAAMDSVRLLGSIDEEGGKKGKGNSPSHLKESSHQSVKESLAQQQQQQQDLSVTSGFLGTLSSLWTSAWGK